MPGLDIGIYFGRPVRSHMLAGELRRRGAAVTVYNNRGSPGTYVPVSLNLSSALRRLLATRHRVYTTSFCFVPALCLYLNRYIRGLPYVFNAVGLMSATYEERAKRLPSPRLAQHWLYPALMRRVIGGAHTIICNSQYLREKCAAEFPQYAHKMATIYNGIEFERFAQGRPVMLEGIPQTAPKLIAVMTWDYEGKAAGAKLLIDAMGPIRQRCTEAQLIVAAKARHPRYAREIEDYLETKPWSRSIRIRYNQSNIPDLLASGDLFVYATPPDSNDSLPRALLEAQAAGLAAVTTATAGCPEVVEDGRTGFVVPYDPSLLAEYAVQLLNDPSTRQRMGRDGQERIRQRFSWDRMGAAYHDLFQRVIASPTPQAGRRIFARSGM